MGQIDFAFKYRSARERLLELLKDLRWHPWRKLEEVGGNRYGARLLELKREGWQIIDQPYDDDGQTYQLASKVKGPPRPESVRVYLSPFCAELLVRSGTLTDQARAEVKRALTTFKARRPR